MDVKKLQQKLADAGWYHGAIDGGLGRKTYAALFNHMAKAELGDRALALGDGCAAAFGPAAINSPLRLAHFMAQTATETGAYKALEENLNYTVNGLMKTWPSRFPNAAACDGYANNPKALALFVYSSRLGNGTADTGDGWAYRGRGLIQLTGRTNYTAREKETGIKLVAHPELASDPKTAVQIAALYWTSRKINAAADKDDVAAVRKLVNGGTIGLDDAKIYLARAKQVLA